MLYLVDMGKISKGAQKKMSHCVLFAVCLDLAFTWHLALTPHREKRTEMSKWLGSEVKWKRV